MEKKQSDCDELLAKANTTATSSGSILNAAHNKLKFENNDLKVENKKLKVENNDLKVAIKHCTVGYRNFTSEFITFYRDFGNYFEHYIQKAVDENLFSENLNLQKFPTLTNLVKRNTTNTTYSVQQQYEDMEVENSNMLGEIYILQQNMTRCGDELIAVYVEFEKFFMGFENAEQETKMYVEANMLSINPTNNNYNFPHLLSHINGYKFLTTTNQVVATTAPGGLAQFFGATSVANKNLPTPEKFFYRWMYNYEPEAIIDAYKLTPSYKYKTITVGVTKGERVGTFIDDIWLNNYQKYIDVKMLTKINHTTRPVPTDDQIPSYLIFGHQLVNPNSVDVSTKISAEYMITLLRETLRNIIIRVEMATDKYEMKEYNYLSDPINHILKYLLNYNVISF